MRKPVYIFNGGELQRHQNTLRFTLADGGGRRFVPVETTSEIHVFGEVSVNTKLLIFLSQNAIPLHVYNHYGYWSGSYMPREQYVSGYMTLQQAAHYLNHDKRMELACTFVRGAIANMEKVLPTTLAGAYPWRKLWKRSPAERRAWPPR